MAGGIIIPGGGATTTFATPISGIKPPPPTTASPLFGSSGGLGTTPTLDTPSNAIDKLTFSNLKIQFLSMIFLMLTLGMFL